MADFQAAPFIAAALALGIAAASFASQPSLECGNGNEDYEKGLGGGTNTSRAKIQRKARRRSRNAPQKKIEN